MALVVHPANIQDRDGGRLVIEQLGTGFRRLRLIFADGGYAGKFVDWTRGWFFRSVEIVKRPDTRCGLGGEALFLIQSKDPEHP